ncbi:MAG: extracellular solute-binding protein [Streptosporangiaceae bacterium]
MTSPTRRWQVRLAALACLVLASAGCGSASSASSTSGSGSGSGGSRKVSGTANVAYAGSLIYLNEKVIGPAFTRATGYASGQGNGADALSAEIASGEIHPNVFISVGGKPITALEPKSTEWYVQYAATSIVLAYNPASRYASQFQAIAAGRKPMADLFRLMVQPGFQLGRTDPNVDPQGRAFIYMLELAQRAYHLPAGTVTRILRGPAASANSAQIFSETSLEAHLQAGQLDAASAYLSEAVQLHLHYIALPAAINLGDPAQAANYAKASITIGGKTMRGAPLAIDITTIGTADRAAAASYVAYVLSPAGRARYAKGGYALLRPTAVGDTAAIPAAIRHVLGG